MRSIRALSFVVVLFAAQPALFAQEGEQPTAPVRALPGTQPLTMQGDIASELVAGADRFVLAEIEKSVERRAAHWKRDLSSAEAYNASVEPNRKRLAHIMGVRDARVPFDGPQYTGTTERPALVGRGDGYDVFAVRWPAFGDVFGEGLLLVPTGRDIVANIVAIPDCGQTPEQIAGLADGVAPESQYARRLAASGCRVLVPVLINRANRLHDITNREWLYRAAFEMGRGLVAYEVQKVLAGVDWFARENAANPQQAKRIGVIGWSEGGLIALYAAALDPRIDAACVSGYFDNRNNIWQEPMDRNIFGLLEQFGDAELATLIAPRSLIIEAARAAEATSGGNAGGPARVVTPDLAVVRAELDRAKALLDGATFPVNLSLVVSGEGKGAYGSDEALRALLAALDEDATLATAAEAPQRLAAIDVNARHARQLHEIDRHTQWLLRESPYLRQANFWNKLDTSSHEAYAKSTAPWREFFYEEVVGRYPYKPTEPNVRTRLMEDNEKWSRYEVVMDVFPDVIAYGILMVPKGIADGERRPVVVCQHGLEGRPQDTIGEPGHAYYKAFTTALCERGFVTFAPQNLYIFQHRFRSIQRKSYAIKKTIFSVITPQHQQIVDWLQTQPFVDPDRIGFYGLSYGGKTAMRVPALVTDYALSICSADFNEWVDKNASTRNPRSYVNTGEYEIFEFDLGSTFNYAEMAALIAPRPFMVERGHHDGVADDWTVAWEYSKIRLLYASGLKIPERTEIEYFDGPHTINGQGTFDFLHRHLNWPKPE